MSGFRARCRRCGAAIMFGRTRSGRSMPLDPGRHDRDDTTANLAVYRDHTGRVNVRVLTGPDQPEPWEWRAMPHFATCQQVDVERAARAGRLRADGVLPFRPRPVAR